MINKERLWEHLEALSHIGRNDTGGVTRLSYSKEEREAKTLVSNFMKEAGLSVREDEVGNLIGRREGQNPEAPVILLGSHIDSVYYGGNFDGPLGVLSGVEVLQTLKEKGIQTNHPIEVIAFTDEEGARFSFGMIGSRAIAGSLTHDFLEKTDNQGISIREAMESTGFKPEAYTAAIREKGTVKAYVEIHIEQGKVLENEGLSVGCVTGIAGPLWLKFTLEGESGHAGTTPMDLRHDPLAASAIIMQIIEEEARKIETSVGTVGQFQIHPGGINIIPSRVEFALDLRDISESVRDRVEKMIVEKAERICIERNIQLTIEPLQRVAPAPCDEMIQEAIKESCNELGLKPFLLSSGAGHDGMHLTELCPIGMIFVRSRNGISHNPEEWSSKEDCADGANVLYHTVLKLDQ